VKCKSYAFPYLILMSKNFPAFCNPSVSQHWSTKYGVFTNATIVHSVPSLYDLASKYDIKNTKIVLIFAKVSYNSNSVYNTASSLIF
jgi:hypothetical protein